MSRTYRRQHLNKKNRPFFRCRWNSYNEKAEKVKEHLEWCEEVNWKSGRKYGRISFFFSDGYKAVSKNVKQFYKHDSHKQLRSEFRQKVHNFMKSNDDDIILEKHKPRCVKWEIT